MQHIFNQMFFHQMVHFLQPEDSCSAARGFAFFNEWVFSLKNFQYTSQHNKFREVCLTRESARMGCRAREINILLSAIEKEPAKYNLWLNYDKCSYIAMNGNAKKYSLQ